MGPALVRVVVYRRGADRELARALGAIRSPPTPAVPSNGHSAGGRPGVPELGRPVPPRSRRRVRRTSPA